MEAAPLTSYLLRAEHVVPVPDVPGGMSPKEVTDWLERTLGTKNVLMERIGDNVLEFRSPFRPFVSSNEYLRSVSGGELEVRSGPDGPIILLRANPRTWQALIPAVLLVMYIGWGNAAAVMRWGAGIGGVLASGAMLFLIWAGMKSFLATTAGAVRLLPKPDSTSGA